MSYRQRGAYICDHDEASDSSQAFRLDVRANMVAYDPTYPLLTVAYFLSAAMLSLVLLTNFVRHNWNLGVTFLCVWLLLEALADGADTIIWSDNAEIKLYVYCDIGSCSALSLRVRQLTTHRVVSRLRLAVFVAKPMATLTIVRRLYLIANLQSVDLPSKAVVRKSSTGADIVG